MGVLLIWHTGQELGRRIDCLNADWTVARFAPPFSKRSRGETFVGIMRPMPFAANTFDVVYMRRILEHLAPDEAMAFLTEARRVLAPNGILRVSVPDTERDLRAYIAAVERADADPTPDAVAEVHAWRILVMDQYLRRVSGGELGNSLAAGTIPERLLTATYGDALGPVKVGIEAQFAASPPSLSQRLRELIRLLAGRRWVLDPQARRENHVALWDRVSLPDLLEAAGFYFVVERSHRTSLCTDENILALDTAVNGTSEFEPSLVFEARKGQEK